MIEQVNGVHFFLYPNGNRVYHGQVRKSIEWHEIL